MPVVPLLFQCIMYVHLYAVKERRTHASITQRMCAWLYTGKKANELQQSIL